MLKISLLTTLILASSTASSEILNTDSSISHKSSSRVFYTDNSYQIFFKKPAPSNNYQGIEHSCNSRATKNKFYLDPDDKYFNIRKELLDSESLKNFGYECIDYKNWGVIPMIKIVRTH